MTEEQLSDLERIYGDIELIQYDETITDVKKLLAYNADIYAVVLPLNLVALLRSETDEEIIQPVSGREQSDSQIFNQAMGKMESEYIYRHLYWQKIIKVEIITERL